jgi:hypothetical protein
MQISLRLEVLKVFTFDFSLSSNKKEEKDEVKISQPNTITSNKSS